MQNPSNDPGYSAFMEQMAAMNQITREMKEIPELPSEAQKDNHPLQKVEFPETGGVQTYMQGHDYPFWGFPYWEFVDKIDLIKKISRATISGFYHAVGKRNRIRLLTFLPVLWAIKELVFVGVYVFYRIIERFRIKTTRLSPAMQELHRALSIAIPGESSRDAEFRTMFRDLLCMILEFDNAYRFRFQDIIAELDKDNLHRNTVKEILRLVDILQQREKTQEIKDTWKLIRMVVSYYLRYDKRLRNIFYISLLNIDINKARLSKEDKYYSAPRVDYTFAFMVNEDKEDKFFTERGKLWKKWQDEQKKLTENTKLFEAEIHQRHLEEMKKVEPILTLEEQTAFGKRIQDAQEAFQKEQQERTQALQEEIQKKADELNNVFLTESQKDLAKKQTKELKKFRDNYESELKQLEENWVSEKNKAQKDILGN